MNTRLPIPQLRNRFRKRKKSLRKRLKAYLGNDNCAECGASSEELKDVFTSTLSKKAWKRVMTLDHIIPMVLGGHPYSLSNLQFLCYRCHRDKANQETPQIVAHARSSVVRAPG